MSLPPAKKRFRWDLTFASVVVLSFALGGLYFNGRTWNLRCVGLPPESVCDYSVEILGFPLFTGSQRKLQGWREQKGTLHLHFEGDSLSLPYVGSFPPPGVVAPNSRWQVRFNPLESWIFWVVVFGPVIALVIVYFRSVRALR